MPKEILAEIKFTISRDEEGKTHRDVVGFPANHDAAMAMMHEAINIVSRFFMKQAKEGKVDDEGTVTDGKIIVPHNSAALLAEMAKKDFPEAADQ